jgi:hypothetical protein
MKYLILSPSSTQAIAVARQIRKFDPPAILYGGNISNEEYTLKYNHYDFIVEINKVADCENYNYVLPTTSYSTKIYTSWVKDFKVGNVQFNSSSLNVYNKIWLLGNALNCDIHVPDTWGSFNEIPDCSNGIFIKPKYEGSDAVRTWVRKKERIPERIRNNDGYLFQELIPGKDVFGYCFIASEGKVILSFMHHELCSVPKDGGNAVILTKYNNSYLEELNKKLLKQIEFTGWGLVEWKYCNKRQDFVLMEINAKLWASIEFALRNESGFLYQFFGIEGICENISSIFWPSRLASTIFSNGKTFLKARQRYKLVKGWEHYTFIDIIKTWIPILLKDKLKYLVNRVPI